MNDAKLIRELKEIIYYIRQYGIDRVNESIENILADETLMTEFHTQVHKGFYSAQEKVLHLLPKLINEQKRIKKELTEARRQRNKDQSTLLLSELRKAEYQECVVRKSMDAIAWQLFNYELSTLRRLFCNEEPIDITDSNIESEMAFLSQFQHSSPTGFALISDLTSFVQIGDIVTRIPNEGLKLIELKEGRVNEKVFQLIGDTMQNPCPKYLEERLRNENQSFVKHFERTVKQVAKDTSTCNTINNGTGIDHASGLNVQIFEGNSAPDTFSTVMHNLSVEYHKKGYSFAAVQECLIIGVYDISRFPCEAFDIWAKELDIKDPVFDLRQSFYDPLGRPIYLHPFSESFITDVITGKIVVKMAINTEQWLNMLEPAGCKIRHLSKKETARIKSKSKASNTLYELNGQGIEIEKDGAKIYLGQGMFSKMFTSFFTPLSMCQEIISTLDAMNHSSKDSSYSSI